MVGGVWALLASVAELLAGWVLGPISVQDSAKRLNRVARAYLTLRAPDTHYTILVADLVGDTSGSQTENLRQALLGWRGFASGGCASRST